MSTGRSRLIKIAKFVTSLTGLLTLLLIAAMLEGVSTMVAAVATHGVVAVGVAAGSRVEGSNCRELEPSVAYALRQRRSAIGGHCESKEVPSQAATVCRIEERSHSDAINYWTTRLD